MKKILTPYGTNSIPIYRVMIGSWRMEVELGAGDGLRWSWWWRLKVEMEDESGGDVWSRCWWWSWVQKLATGG